jgi:hypothetical protein
MTTPDRKTYLSTMVGLLRGVEGALDTLGWDRIYSTPTKTRAIYAGGKSEAELAKYQKNQGKTNDCAAYSVAAALRLLADQPPVQEVSAQLSRPLSQVVSYEYSVDVANRHAALRSNVLGGVKEVLSGEDLRVWAGGPTMPRHQARLARELAARYSLDVDARVMRGTADDLLHYLAMPDTYVLVTIGWSKDTRPRIQYPDGEFRTFGKPETFKVGGMSVDGPFTAHVMMLAAYDPDRKGKLDHKNVTVPWGFVNSWVDAGDGLYWMTEDDFRDAWRFVIPLVGRQQMVVIQKQS